MSLNYPDPRGDWGRGVVRMVKPQHEAGHAHCR